VIAMNNQKDCDMDTDVTALTFLTDALPALRIFAQIVRRLTTQLDTKKQPSDNEVVINTLFEGD
jgi:hypothetical protein